MKIIDYILGKEPIRKVFARDADKQTIELCKAGFYALNDTIEDYKHKQFLSGLSLQDIYNLCYIEINAGSCITRWEAKKILDNDGIN